MSGFYIETTKGPLMINILDNISRVSLSANKLSGKIRICYELDLDMNNIVNIDDPILSVRVDVSGVYAQLNTTLSHESVSPIYVQNGDKLTSVDLINMAQDR